MNQTTVTKYGAWIGLRRDFNNEFHWVDGTPVKGHYHNWNRGEPNDNYGYEDCGHIWGTTTKYTPGKWNDVPCAMPVNVWHTRDDFPVVLCQKPI